MTLHDLERPRYFLKCRKLGRQNRTGKTGQQRMRYEWLWTAWAPKKVCKRRPGRQRRHDRRRGSVAHLRHGLGAAGAGPARHLPAHPAQRVRGHHGPLGLGQVHADEPHRLPGHALQGPLLAQRPVGQRAGRRPAGAHPQQGDRLRLSDLQPAGPGHRAAQRGAAADL